MLAYHWMRSAYFHAHMDRGILIIGTVVEFPGKE